VIVLYLTTDPSGIVTGGTITATDGNVHDLTVQGNALMGGPYQEMVYYKGIFYTNVGNTLNHATCP
jgi:hypothetical protein